MIDPAWQITALASAAVAVPVGIAIRRGIERLDEVRRERTAPAPRRRHAMSARR
jgi:hypothetical protein